MSGRKGVLVGFVVLIAGCSAFAFAVLEANDKRDVATARAADAGRRTPDGARAGKKLPGPQTPLESIDFDSLQSINPVYTVPRSQRLHGQEGERWAQQHLIGLSFRQADALAASRGMSVRIVELDGRVMPVQLSNLVSRVNVALGQSEIVGIDGMG